MKIELGDMTAVVTGASAGIGWGCALGLAQAGATGVLVARRDDALAQARERIIAVVPDADVRIVSADLSRAEGCDALVRQQPRCDILVNNLGAFNRRPFFETADADWHAAFDVNLMPGVRLARSYMPAMMREGWGRVVFLASEAGVNIPTDSLHYGATKAAVLALSRGLAKLAGRSGVTVNAVLPGVTGSEWVEGMIAERAASGGSERDEAAYEMVLARYPTSITQRVQSVEEVANLVVYLCSRLSSATTGSALRAEGGIIDTPF